MFKIKGDKIAVTDDGAAPPPGPLVYSGGNHQAITRLLGAQGPDVIYCGDHLHADVVKCRKLCEWRTLLIVPELRQEVSCYFDMDFSYLFLLFFR